LRLLFARAGTPYCPDHGVALQSQSVSQMVDAVMALPEDTKLMLLAPIARDRKGEFAEVFADLQAQGYVRFRINGEVFEFDNLPALKKNEKHDIDVVIDRVKVRHESIAGADTDASRVLQDSVADMARSDQAVTTPTPGLRQRLAESFEAALRLAEGRAIALEMDSGTEHGFNAKFACTQCHIHHQRA